jgi:tRNA wybutosine-synthesizing protein 2
MLKEKLRDKISEEEFELIPRGFQKTGEIIIMNLPIGLESKFFAIGEAVLQVFPKAKTVCVKVGEIIGTLRRPQIKVIAGSDDLRVENFENGTWFCYDAGKIMFAKGNVSERGRLPKLVKNGEIIVDMFVGIGYFSLPIARHSGVKKIYAIDLNSDSIHWLKEGIKKNKVENKFEVFNGDSKLQVDELVEKGVVVDRVLMGYLPPPEEFVPYALRILKKGGFVHYDALIRTDQIESDLEKVRQLFQNAADSMCEVQGAGYEKRNVVIFNPQRVKSYRPKVDHYVIDLRVD